MIILVFAHTMCASNDSIYLKSSSSFLYITRHNEADKCNFRFKVFYWFIRINKCKRLKKILNISRWLNQFCELWKKFTHWLWFVKVILRPQKCTNEKNVVIVTVYSSASQPKIYCFNYFIPVQLPCIKILNVVLSMCCDIAAVMAYGFGTLSKDDKCELIFDLDGSKQMI